MQTLLAAHLLARLFLFIAETEHHGIRTSHTALPRCVSNDLQIYAVYLCTKPLNHIFPTRMSLKLQKPQVVQLRAATGPGRFFAAVLSLPLPAEQSCSSSQLALSCAAFGTCLLPAVLPFLHMDFCQCLSLRPRSFAVHHPLNGSASQSGECWPLPFLVGPPVAVAAGLINVCCCLVG